MFVSQCVHVRTCVWYSLTPRPQGSGDTQYKFLGEAMQCLHDITNYAGVKSISLAYDNVQKQIKMNTTSEVDSDRNKVSLSCAEA